MIEPQKDQPARPCAREFTVLLVDDHELVRNGLKLLIEAVAPRARVLESGTGEQSIDVVRNTDIELVFMDIILPGMDGISTALRLIDIRPDIKVLVLTGASELVVPRALLESGISGYVTKSCAAAEIGNAMKSVRRGEFFVSSDLQDRFEYNATAPIETTPFDRLSSRELEVVLLLIKGFKTIEAGESLTLNVKTVSTYKRRAFDKLGVDNTAALVRLAMEHSILGY